MPNIKTVKPAGGGDFTTLNSWWGSTFNLTSAAQWAECYSGDLGYLDLVSVPWMGNTPDASNYIRIYAATGEKFNPVGPQPTGAYITGGAFSQPCALLGPDYVRIDDILLYGDGTQYGVTNVMAII